MVHIFIYLKIYIHAHVLIFLKEQIYTRINLFLFFLRNIIYIYLFERLKIYNKILQHRRRMHLAVKKNIFLIFLLK